MMTSITSLPFLVMVLGFLVWRVATRPKFQSAFWAEVGRISFAFGLLVVLLNMAGKSLY